MLSRTEASPRRPCSIRSGNYRNAIRRLVRSALPCSICFVPLTCIAETFGNSLKPAPVLRFAFQCYNIEIQCLNIE